MSPFSKSRDIFKSRNIFFSLSTNFTQCPSRSLLCCCCFLLSFPLPFRHYRLRGNDEKEARVTKGEREGRSERSWSLEMELEHFHERSSRVLWRHVGARALEEKNKRLVCVWGLCSSLLVLQWRQLQWKCSRALLLIAVILESSEIFNESELRDKS